MTKKKRGRKDFEKATEQLLKAVDVKAEYELIGAQFTSDKKSASGWLQCRALDGREDRNPSAGVCVEGSKLGRYHDFATGQDLSIFDALATFGPYRDFRDARSYLADKLKIPFPDNELANGRAASDPATRYDLVENEIVEATHLGIFAESKGVSVDACRAFGLKVAHYPAGAADPQTVVVVPTVDPYPCGAILYPTRGLLLKYKGKDKEPEQVKTMLASGSSAGWVAYSPADAEIVFRVEGAADALALYDAIPPELAGKVAIFSPSAGCKQQKAREAVLPLIKSRQLYVVGDRDKDGVEGAIGFAAWCVDNGEALSVTILDLPYEVVDKHGKDLRDFFAEGNSYANLVLAPSTPATSGVRELYDNRADELLEKVGIDVLGIDRDADEIFMSHTSSNQVIRIKSAYAGNMPWAVMPAYFPGVQVFVDQPQPGEESDNLKATPADLRQAIANAAGRREITAGEIYGQGVWPGRDGKVVVVTDGRAGIIDGDSIEITTRPTGGGLMLNLACEDWVDLDLLGKHLGEADDEFCEKAVGDLLDVLHCWQWGSFAMPRTAVGLLLASFVQTLLPMRPLVSVTGKSGAGKTTFLEVLAEIAGAALLASKSTAAGLMQALRQSAAIPLLDEFESDKHRESILELARTTTRSGAKILRGTATGQASSAGLRHLLWFAAIDIDLKRAPNWNRFVYLTIVGHGTGDPMPADPRDLGTRLLAVAIKCRARAIEIYKRLHSLSVGDLDGRLVECYAMTAAFWSAATATPQSDEAAVLGDMASGIESTPQERMSDGEGVLRAILAATVPYGVGTHKNAQIDRLITEAVGESDHAKHALEAVGLRVRRRRGESGYFLAISSGADRLLDGTAWAGQASAPHLLTIEGCESRTERIVGGGASNRCRVIYIDRLNQLLDRGGDDTGYDEGDEPATLPFH